MANSKQNISIEEFVENKSQTNVFEEEDNALVTHYLHNYNNGVSKHYKMDANQVLNKIVKHKKQLNKTIDFENALQTLLFEVENVPFPSPKNYTFKFIVLFAGIGGFGLGINL